MPKISNVTLNLSQTGRQEKLGLVKVEYTYTLECNKKECLAKTGFDVSVNLVGVDPLLDDNLEYGLDDHDIACEPEGEKCKPQPYTRSFIIARSLLNEDWGGDEIQLDLQARSGAGGLTEASSSTVTVP